MSAEAKESPSVKEKGDLPPVPNKIRDLCVTTPLYVRFSTRGDSGKQLGLGNEE